MSVESVSIEHSNSKKKMQTSFFTISRLHKEICSFFLNFSYNILAKQNTKNSTAQNAQGINKTKMILFFCESE